jgi:zinc protease
MRFSSRVLSILAVLVIGGTVPAAALDIDVSSFGLENGLQVVVIPDRRAPVVTHMIWYKVGAADEPQGKAGIAHFLEHLMFKGTSRHPAGEFSRVVRLNGGEENAFTSQDFTAYFQRIAKDRLALVMEFEADRMQNLLLTDENVLPELKVVQEERRERIENDPSSLLAEQLDAALYTAHPYGKPVIGWMSEVAGLTRQDALEFYAAHYEPGNAILVVAGDVTAQEVEKLARAHYGPLKNRQQIKQRRRTAEPEPVAERRVTMRDKRVSSPVWQRKYLAPAARHLNRRDELALMLLAEVIGGGSQSRLHQKLALEQKIAAHVGAWYSADALDSGAFGIFAAPNPGIEVRLLEEAIDNVLKDVQAQKIGQDELDRTRNRVIAEATYVLDSQHELARIFGTALATGQKIEDVLGWEADLARVTIDDLAKAGSSVLVSRASVTGLLLPAENQ